MQAFNNLPPFVRLIFWIVGIALLVWSTTFLPLPAPFPTIILVVGVLAAVYLAVTTFMSGRAV